MPQELKTDIWKNISVYCLNHDEPKRMEVLRNDEKFTSPFYACSELIDGSGHCPNRVNLDDYQDLIYRFFDVIAEQPFADLTNFTFTFRKRKHTLFVKVLKYDRDDMRLGIKNRTVLGE